MLPFRLKPYLKEVIWGGNNIAALKGEKYPSSQIGESWEVSAMPGCESVIETGDLAGMNLAEACRKFGKQLLGESVVERYGNEFPILIKFIDATRDLSIQVHPDDVTAVARHGCNGKCEMWYIVECRPGATIIPGFKKSLSAEEFEKHLNAGTLMDTLAVYESRPGDVYYIPAGRVHAACQGNLILEVQQASDVTYRIYDYDRIGSDGKKRELHYEMARDVIGLDAQEEYRIDYKDDTLIETPHFKVSKIDFCKGKEINIDYDTFSVLVVIDGHVLMESDGSSIDASSGQSFLIPASNKVKLSGEGRALLITV